MNFVPFSERAVELVVELYVTHAPHPAVVNNHVLQKVIKVGTLRFFLLIVLFSVKQLFLQISVISVRFWWFIQFLLIH